jgi:hypothetical protein
MDFLIALPGLVAALALIRFSLQTVFLWVFLPSLLLLPNYYRLGIGGLPKATFAAAAAIPILVVWLARLPRWKFTLLDGILLLSWMWILASEAVNYGSSAVRSLTFDLLTGTAFPYVFCREMIEPQDRHRLIRALSIQLAIVAIFNVWEFRMATSPYRLVFDRLFAEQHSGWVTQLRWGFGRAAGPYGHAILAGIMFGVTSLLCWWGTTRGAWKRFRLPIPGGAGLWIPLFLAGGLFTTLSRGPWIGAGLGGVWLLVTRARNPRRAMLSGLAVIAVAALGVGVLLQSYSSVGRSQAVTAEQETAAYRAELMDLYLPAVFERPWLGWGMSFPVAPGAPSVDNQFLLVALLRGIVGLALFCLIIIVIAGRLFRGAFQRGIDHDERMWRLTLFAVQICFAFSLTTVWMGEQVATLFWIMAGWSEGTLLRAAHRNRLRPAAGPVANPHPLSFVRVIA